ncbi:hypothetical protein T4E_10083 [Trichinella pseudospiralis]|uniref:Uncharacterized protein n=1 Tax=Trichinella pseudospiralis TaxID=6337 RepID=A0A0V0YL93_TRIPS|nr:hypothetical protein T4E_10083 [Trichinella pseudospiralis]
MDISHKISYFNSILIAFVLDFVTIAGTYESKTCVRKVSHSEDLAEWQSRQMILDIVEISGSQSLLNKHKSDEGAVRPIDLIIPVRFRQPLTSYTNPLNTHKLQVTTQI